MLVTVFIQAGMYMLMAPVGIATLTGPFCITTWLFLLPLVRFDDEEKPDHSNWYPENKKHLGRSSRARKRNNRPSGPAGAGRGDLKT